MSIISTSSKTSHVTQGYTVNVFRHTYNRVMSHISTSSKMSHVTQSMSHKATRSMSSVTHTIESCHTYQRLRKRVMSHVPVSHVTRTNESCHRYK